MHHPHVAEGFHLVAVEVLVGRIAVQQHVVLLKADVAEQLANFHAAKITTLQPARSQQSNGRPFAFGRHRHSRPRADRRTLRRQRLCRGWLGQRRALGLAKERQKQHQQKKDA